MQSASDMGGVLDFQVLEWWDLVICLHYRLVLLHLYLVPTCNQRRNCKLGASLQIYPR